MFRLTAAALLAATFIGGANGQTGRVEILPFTSKTLTDTAFLSGAKTGRDVTIGSCASRRLKLTSFPPSSCYTGLVDWEAPVRQSMNGQDH